MAEQIYYSVFTKKGLELLTEAIRNGTKLGITSMAFGDGGGSLPVPNENFTSMVREVHRTQLNSLAPDPNNANWLRADAIIASATGGFNIRELGLYAGNVLVAYSNYPPTYKPNPSDGTARIMSFRMILQIDNTANFDLVIDPDVVLATIQKVEDAKLEIYQNTATTLHQLSELEDLEKWPGRTIFIKTRQGEENSFFSGTFVYHEDSNDAVDNGIVLDAAVGRWIRKIESNVIKAQWFGNPNQIDDQKILNSAFNASRNYKMFVDITGSEWGINGVVSAVEQLSLISDFNSPIHVDPNGIYPRQFAVEFGLPGSVWYQNGCVLTNSGFLRVECKNRDTQLHGVFIKGPFSNIDIIRAVNFNGTGIKLESVHDTPIKRLSVELCGNETDYAFVCGSADDTTNCIHINALQVEQSKQRGIYITNTIRSVIDNIHSERLNRTNQAPVDNLIGNDLNHVIQMNNSVINQAIIHSNDGDIYVRLDGAVNNYNNFYVPNGYVYGEYGDQVVYSCLNTKVFKQLSILRDITLDQPSIPVVHVTIGTKINNPNINELVFEYATKSITVDGGKVNKIGVRSASEINGSISFNNVAIKEIHETGSNSVLATSFINCSIDLLEGMDGRTCNFRDSYIYKADLASGLQAYFDNIKFDSFNGNGDIKYLTRNCQSVNTANWSVPTVAMNNGLITERIGYDASGKTYQNTDGNVNWQKLF